MLILGPGHLCSHYSHHRNTATPREPLRGRHSQTILGPASVIQDMCLNDTDKGRESFSKIKWIVHKTESRSRKALVEAIGAALSAVTALDGRGFFEHCGCHRVV